MRAPYTRPRAITLERALLHTHAPTHARLRARLHAPHTRVTRAHAPQHAPLRAKPYATITQAHTIVRNL